MEETLCHVFAGSLHSDRTIRDAAEAHLMAMSSSDALLPIVLLRFCASPHSAAQVAACGGSSPSSVKLAAAVRLRNVINKSHWKHSAFSEELKQQFKNEIVTLSCGLHLDEAIRRQLAATMEALVSYDYPLQWPNLVPELQVTIGNAIAALGEQRMEASITLAAALHALRCCCKRYEDVTEFVENQIDSFANSFVGSLMQLGTSLMQTVTTLPNNAQYLNPLCSRQRDAVHELWHCTRMVWKCLWSLLAHRWPMCLCSLDAATAFMTLLTQTLTFAVSTLRGTASLSADAVVLAAQGRELGIATFNAIPSWRALKWVMKIAQRTLANFALTPKSSEKRSRNAAQLLYDSMVVNVTQLCLEFVRWHQPALSGSDAAGAGITRCMTSKVMILAIEILELVATSSHKAAYEQVIVPAATELLESLLFQRLFFAEEDAELWSYNPEEYVRKLTDPRGDLYNPKLVSMSLIVSLCRPSKPFHNATLMTTFTGFLVGQIQSLFPHLGSENRSIVTNVVAPKYDGCLFGITQLKKLLHVSEGQHDARSGAATAPVDAAKVEWLLATYVAPLLQCSVGYLRARAVYALSLFCDMQWSSSQMFHSMLRGVLMLLFNKDEELPVQIQTCASLSKFIRQEAAREVVTPHVGEIVQRYFDIMKKMDHDGVVRTLRKTIKFYGDALGQWAVQLTQMLVQHFLVVHEQLVQKNRELDVQSGGETQSPNVGDDIMDNDVVDSLMAADEFVETLRTVVMAVPQGDGAAAMMHAMHESVAPLLTVILSPQQNGASLGFMDRCLHLLTTLLSRSTAVHPCLWPLIGYLYTMVMGGNILDYVEQLVAPLDNFVSVDAAGFYRTPVAVAVSGGSLTAPPIQLIIDMCRKVVQDASSLHHYASVPPLMDAVLLHGWDSANEKGAPSPSEVAAAAVPCLELSLKVLSQKAASFPPTLQLLYANSIMVSIIVAADAAAPVILQSGAASFILNAIATLLVTHVVQEHMRSFDKKVFVAGMTRLLTFACEAAAAQQQSELATACFGLFQEIASGTCQVFGSIAEHDTRLLRGEIGYHEKRIKGELDSEDDDSMYDEFADSDDDDTDEDGSDFGDEWNDGDEVDADDDGDDVNADGDIRNQGQYAQALAKARELRDDDLQEEMDAEANFLGSDDFVTPLDDVNVWARLVEAVQAAGAVVSIDSQQASKVWEAATLAARCEELRKMNPTR